MKKWNDKLWLFTIPEYEMLPDGFELKCINGGIRVKGKDDIDMDTRWDCIAYGIEDPANHPESELFTFMRLACD